MITVSIIGKPIALASLAAFGIVVAKRRGASETSTLTWKISKPSCPPKQRWLR